jgi:hypothetical protein
MAQMNTKLRCFAVQAQTGSLQSKALVGLRRSGDGPNGIVSKVTDITIRLNNHCVVPLK